VASDLPELGEEAGPISAVLLEEKLSALNMALADSGQDDDTKKNGN
jgi:hypothetical protein